jgi:phage gp45-like
LNIVRNIISSFKKFAKNENNSQVAKTLEFEETVKDVEFFQTPGIVSGLTSSDEIAVIPIDGGGYKIGIASFNYKISISVTPGQTKIFSTDPTGLIKMAEIILDTNGKIKMSNSTQSIKSIMDDIIDELIDFKTFGTPANHTTDPSTVVNLNLIKTKIGLLLY